MMEGGGMVLRRVVFILLLLVVAASSGSQVKFYDDPVAFRWASVTTVQADFENFTLGLQPPVIVSGSLIFSQVGLFVVGPGSAGDQFFDPHVTSKVLTVSGNEDFDVWFTGVVTAVGLDTYTNRYAPPIITVFDAQNRLIGASILNQGPNTIGFFGVTSGVPIGRIHWLASGGQVQNTGIDNVRVGYVLPGSPLPTPDSLHRISGR